MAYKRYIKVDKDGCITSDTVTSNVLDDESGWIEIPRKDSHVLGAPLDSLRYDKGVGISKKIEIELAVGRRMLPADGESVCAIGVRHMPDKKTTVRILVGDTFYDVCQDEDLALSTTKVGQFAVRVCDPYYYAPMLFGTNSIIIQTYEPEEPEEDE